MSEATGALYSYSGMLRVHATGYWFSAGGEKGSFGYYPHLKDQNGRPVYPDTQVHGDLKMAACWLDELEEKKYSDLVVKVFGRGGETGGIPQASRFFPGDLILDAKSIPSWSNNRFEVKNKIKVDALSRRIINKFLVNLELAWLQGLTLEAPFILGPFSTEKELLEGRSLIEKAVDLLSGFGAFRSRGKSRRSVFSFSWQITGNQPVLSSLPPAIPCLYSLTAKTHFRNSPVSPGNTQVVETGAAVTSEQLKGWLSLTYNALYKEWPSPADIASLEITPLYPSPSQDVLALPAPMTSLRMEDGKTFIDRWSPVAPCPDASADRSVNEDKESYFSKSKPLRGQYTVTSGCEVYKIPVASRFHNKMDSSFTTQINGLFVQEYLPAGTVFTGSLRFTKPESDFSQKAWLILTRHQPIIKGTVFCSGYCTLPIPEPATPPWLVIEPIPYESNSISEKDQIILSSQWRYNSTLKRKRRPLPVIMPGSILSQPRVSGTVSWPGFGKPLTLPEAPGTNENQDLPEVVKPLETTAKGQKAIALLRLLYGAGMSSERLDERLSYFIKKYDGKDVQQQLLRELMEKARCSLLHEGVDMLRKRLKATHNNLKEQEWTPKTNMAAEPAQLDGGVE